MLGRIASRTTSSASRRWQRSATARWIRGHSYRRVVAATEIVCWVGFTAILAGLTFVGFSRPARDPTLATLVHEIRSYAAENTRFGMRYTDAATKEEDGTPVLDLTRIGALEPGNGDQQEQGWTEREEERE